jgi:hypothetical protein
MHIRVDHTEPKMEIQAEQAQWMFEGPQASSCKDANIVVIKASSGALTMFLVLCFLNLALCFTLIVH